MIATLRKDSDLIGHVDDEVAVVTARLDEWRPDYEPRDAREEWLFAQVVVHSIRVDRCQQHGSALRASQARRAAASWDVDRRFAAEVLFQKISKNPSLTVLQLRQTPQGCDALIARWISLGAALENHGDWDEKQKALAHDLLGTPAVFRDVKPLPDSPKDLVDREITRLKEHKAGGIATLDALERRNASNGMGEYSADLKAVIRYEAQCMRRLEWARKEFFAGRDGTKAPTEPTPVNAPRFDADSEYEPISEGEYVEHDAEVFRRLLAPKQAAPRRPRAPRPRRSP